MVSSHYLYSLSNNYVTVGLLIEVFIGQSLEFSVSDAIISCENAFNSS